MSENGPSQQVGNIQDHATKKIEKCKNSAMRSRGFEPLPLSRFELESNALDHSAMNAFLIFRFLLNQYEKTRSEKYIWSGQNDR